MCGRFAAGCALACVVVLPLAAAELQPRTLQAYAEYVAAARQAFLDRVHAAGEASSDGGSNGSDGSDGSDGGDARTADAPRPAQGEIVKVPGGLVHHWSSAIFIPDVGLDRVLAVSQAYDNQAAVHKHISRSRVVQRDGDVFTVQARLRQEAGGVSAVLDMRLVVAYERTGTCAYSLGRAEEIRQVSNPGESIEALLPPGRDSGYLWAADSFTHFSPRKGGVLVELEMIGLSRGIPVLFRWFVEPIVRRVGRGSVERPLKELRAAVLGVPQGRPRDDAP